MPSPIKLAFTLVSCSVAQLVVLLLSFALRDSARSASLRYLSLAFSLAIRHLPLAIPFPPHV
jgi:hypothetical protein